MLCFHVHRQRPYRYLNLDFLGAIFTQLQPWLKKIDGFPVTVFGMTFWHHILIYLFTPVCISAPCTGSAFFCHSNMCINTSLVCNGVQNCVFPWDESNCKGTCLCHSTCNSLKTCCVVVYCRDLHYVIQYVPCLAVVSHWASLRNCSYNDTTYL